MTHTPSTDPSRETEEVSERPFTVEQSNELAEHLIYELFPHIGDQDAVADVCRKWLDEVGVARFGMTCMSALNLIFTDHFKNITPETNQETS